MSLIFLNAFAIYIVQDSESILPQKIPSCHICKDIHMWKYFYISAWVSLYQNQMVRKTTEKEEEGQIDTKGKKNTVTVAAKTKLNSVQAKVS